MNAKTYQNTNWAAREERKMDTASRLAKTYPLETLRAMRISAGIALDRAKGREIHPARQRCWTLDDALDLSAKRPTK